MEMNILDWLKDQLKKIQESNDEPYKIQIANYKNALETLTKDNNGLCFVIEDLHEDIAKYQDTIKSLNKHVTIAKYKEWLDINIVAKPRYYDFGNGRKQVHTIFADSIKDEEIIRDFIENDLKFEMQPTWTVDQMVYWFNRKLSNDFPTIKYYRYDSDLYGKMEYWATAKETIEHIREDNVIGDCDDSMTLRYSCLYYLLQDKFPEELWRLRGFIVDIWTGGGHALLAWIKEGPNDWIPIETTFLDVKEGVIWNGNYRIRDQLLYQIRYSFDHETEYERI